MIVKKGWLIGVAALLGLVLVGLIAKNKFFGKPGPAAISISTTPKATVFIDGSQVGTTPYLDDKVVAGEHIVKLVPEATTDSLTTWEGKVNLTSNILTVINRTLGQNESASSGEIIWLEKIASKDKSSLTVVSVPDQSVIKLEGEPKGFAPVTIEELNPGSYQIVVASPGYEERSVSAKTVAGYKLVINVQLAKKIEGIEEATSSAQQAEASPTPTPKATPSPKATPTPKATATPPEKPYVIIKETPTGWLRVRMGPSKEATEAAKINPGEMFPYLDEQKSGWYKIEYEKDKEGWVSGIYVELVE